MSGEIIYRGDIASLIRRISADHGPDTFKKNHDFIPALPDSKDLVIDSKFDENTNTFSVSYQGTAETEWSSDKGRKITFYFNNDGIEWKPDFQRNTNSIDIPVIMDFPVFHIDSETIILPDGGANSILQGKSFDRTVAGTRISRTLTLENGRATARSVFKRLQSEISAQEALASKDILSEINHDEALVISPPSKANAPTLTPVTYIRTDISKMQPKTAIEYLKRAAFFCC